MTPRTILLAQAEAIAPWALRPSAARRARLWGMVAVGAAALWWMGLDLGLAPDVLFTGFGKLGRLFGSMFPPNADGQELRILRALAETFAMALVGTVLATAAALPLGVLGAKTVVRNPVLHFGLRRLLDLFRGVPALVWALILVSAFGLGPFGGVIALALADIPNLAKLFAEAIETGDERPLDGVRAAGADDLAVLRYGLAPQVIPVMASQTLFFLEGNFRNAAVLGIVGAGGIGFELEERIRIFAFDQMAFIVILYLISVAALDFVSQALRARLA